MSLTTRRVGWGLADQAVSSLTNFAMVIIAARSIGTASFGALAIALAVGATVIGLSRAVAGEPLVVRFAAASAADRRRALGGALGAAVVVGVVAATLVAVAALLVGGRVGDALLPLGAVLPGLVVQDAYRFVLVADGQARKALASDAAWFVAQLGLFALVTLGPRDAGTAVLVWGAGASVGALVAYATCRIAPRLHEARAWLRNQRDLWPRFTGEVLALTGSWQLALVGLGVVAGLESVGALRGAQVLLGPLNVAFLAVPLVMVPESSRLWSRGHSAPPRHARLVGGALVGVALAWGAVLLLLPSGAGRTLLGASWAEARDLVVPVTLVMAAVGVTLGALTGLRVLGAARESLRARIVSAAVVFVAIVAGGAGAAAPGAAWAWAAAAAVGAGVWWHALQRAWRRADADRVNVELAVVT